MGKRILYSMLAGLVVLGATERPSQGERLRFASHFKRSSYFVLPVLAALENGFWKEEGIAVQWLPFDAASVMVQAVAAGEVDMGTHGMDSVIIAASRGVPEIIVADPGMMVEFFFWVHPDSPIKQPQELKGKVMGISRFGGSPHRLAQIVVRFLGLENQVKFVALGGGVPKVAAFRARRVDVVSETAFDAAPLVAMGEVKKLLKVSDYVPEVVGSQVIFARSDFATKNKELASKAIKGFLKGGAFVMANPRWSKQKLISEFYLTEKTADVTFLELKYGTQAKVDKGKIQESIDFLVKYGLVNHAEVPPLERIFLDLS